MNNTIDKVYKHYKTLRDHTVTNWNEANQIPLTNSEWNCLSAVVRGAHSIPEIMKHNEISKQAAHKMVKNLVDKHLLEMTLMNSSKVRYEISLTPLGKTTFDRSLHRQQAVEQQIKQTLGLEDYEKLQQILKKKWI